MLSGFQHPIELYSLNGQQVHRCVEAKFIEVLSSPPVFEHPFSAPTDVCDVAGIPILFIIPSKKGHKEDHKNEINSNTTKHRVRIAK